MKTTTPDGGKDPVDHPGDPVDHPGDPVDHPGDPVDATYAAVLMIHGDAGGNVPMGPRKLRKPWKPRKPPEGTA